MGMSTEKAVKAATKIKIAPPKQKYIEFLLSGTYSDASLAEIFRILSFRLRDTSWPIVFKALVVIHILIREGSQDAALSYLAENPRTITISGLTDVQYQGNNVYAYAEYLRSRADAYRSTGQDYVRDGQGRLKSLTVAKGLLRETEIVQKQMHSLLKCEFLTDEAENDVTLTGYRMVTMDLMMLFSVVNEGTINILEHYFEMSRPDSERSLALYKRFAQQTDSVVRFLRIARHFESSTRLSIPNLKHASIDLARLLEEDLNDPTFDERRRSMRGESIKTAPTAINGERPPPKPAKNPEPTISHDLLYDTSAPGGGTNDLFGSIEQPSSLTGPQATGQQPQLSQQMQMQQQQQQPQLTSSFQAPMQTQQPFGVQQTPMATGWPSMQAPQWNPLGQPQQTGIQAQNTEFAFPFQAQQPPQPQQLQSQNTGSGFMQPQQTGILPQQTGFGFPSQPQQLQPQSTGAGFGGYTPVSQVQQEQQQLQPISSGPPHPSLDFGSPQNQAFTSNPTINSLSYNPTSNNSVAPQPTSAFGSMLTGAGGTGPFNQQPPFPPPPSSVTPIPRQRTSSNPFRSSTVQPQSTGLSSQGTGGTNPFKRLTTVNSLPQLRPQQTAVPLQPTSTGSNPFSRPQVQPPQLPLQPQQTAQPHPLQPQATGSTNPFRSTMLVQQNTVQSSATIGGVAAGSMPTVPVFGVNQGR